MSYSAKVFNIMIASPGDVSAERAIIREVIYEWNAVNSLTRNIVLLPIGWETHSSPEMGDSPQKIINEQVLEKCDILVAVFWTRLGTATGKYPSGTVEEIEEHVSKGKIAMLYFSSKPVVMDSVDTAQYDQLTEFKEQCKSRGLFESYETHAEFRDKLSRQLQLKINEHRDFVNDEGFSDEQEMAELSVVASKIELPELTMEGSILLKEASMDTTGSVLFMRHLGGTNLQTNHKNFITTNERREIAKWESALEELTIEGLLVERGYKGEIFDVTSEGYRVADMISL